MTESGPPVTVTDLHAYVDGQLEPARQAEVEAHLAEHPADAELVGAYRKLNEELHALFDPVLKEPVPAFEAVRGQRRWPPRLVFPPLRVAAALGWLALGAMLGWLAHSPSLSERPSVADLAPYAASVHVVYTPEVRHPVEVAASEQQHLVTWLSKRLGEPLHVPNLKALGYTLVGGRLLAADSKPAAFFLYQDGAGRRLSLVVRKNVWENRETAFRYAREGKVRVFYWIDGPFGCALAGEIDEAELARVAHEVYRQLSP